MLCQECKEREATVHLTRIINGNKTETHLCEECARSKGEWGFLTEPISLHSFLSGILGTFENQVLPQRGTISSNKCNNCGLSYDIFKEKGRFGCNTCYDTFSNQLDPLLQRIHGRGLHDGKVPKRTGGLIRKRKEVDDLRRRMEEAVRREQFEEAADLRDKIHSLEHELKGDADEK